MKTMNYNKYRMPFKPNSRVKQDKEFMWVGADPVQAM